MPLGLVFGGVKVISEQREMSDTAFGVTITPSTENLMVLNRLRKFRSGGHNSTTSFFAESKKQS